jgi:CheY-like chemotaxis protein
MSENRVLIIDDMEDNHIQIKTALNELEYEIVSSYNADEGLMLFQIHKPQIVILDLRMPGKDGVELLQRLEPDENSSFAVIIVTGYGTDEDISKCYELGATAFLHKPIKYVQVKSLVKSLMQSVIFRVELASLRKQVDDLNRKRN